MTRFFKPSTNSSSTAVLKPGVYAKRHAVMPVAQQDWPHGSPAAHHADKDVAGSGCGDPGFANPGTQRHADPEHEHDGDQPGEESEADVFADVLDGLPALLTLKEAAQFLRRSPRTLRSWRRDLDIQTTTIGRAKYVTRATVLKLLGGE